MRYAILFLIFIFHLKDLWFGKERNLKKKANFISSQYNLKNLKTSKKKTTFLLLQVTLVWMKNRS